MPPDVSPGVSRAYDVTSHDAVSLWTGWDLRGGASAVGGPESFVQPSASITEVRYEFLAVAARGFRPPRFLSVADLPAGSENTQRGMDAERGDDGVLRQTWSMAYRQVAETAPKCATPHAIYLLGVNPPEGASDHELEDFNDFYTNVHLREVAERRHALRAVRYELVREVKPPYQGAPRFLAAYEMDEAGAQNRRHVGPPYSSGPDVWQRHTTPWRLWYRVLSASV